MRSLIKLAVRGNGRERGRAHGEALRPLVVEQLGRWKEQLNLDTGFDPDRYVDEFIADTNFLPSIERWTPDLLDEVRGIAEGAGVDFRYAFVRALSDEEPWYRRERVLSGEGKGCSSIGFDARPESPAFVAQNMDMPGWCDGHQVLLNAIDPTASVEVMAFTLAGKISLAGMNSAGLAICCNTLSHLDYARDGLPEDFVVRGFLAQTNLDEGLQFMRAIKHASGQNYTIGAPGKPVLNLECSAGSVALYRPWLGADRVYHTNHPLANDDRAVFRMQSAGLDDDELRRLYHGTSFLRFPVIERAASSVVSPNVDAIKQALSTHPVCRHGELEGRYDHFTLGCLIMELGPVPRFHIAPGPPCCTEFQTFSFI